MLKTGILIGLLAVLLAQAATAGKLREFSDKATASAYVPPPPPPPPAPKPAPKQHDHAHGSAAYSPFGWGRYPSYTGGDSFLGSFSAWLIASPFWLRSDDPGFPSVLDNDASGAPVTTPLDWEHSFGLATLPYARVDYNWQYVDSDIAAHDVRAEVGYKALAFHGRSTMYEDGSDGFRIDINQFYGVLRLSGALPKGVPGEYEFGIGLGGMQFKEDENHSSGAFTIPIKYYPADWFGIEFRPAWYKPVERTIGDYDLSACVGLRHVQLRVGYRWLWLSGEGDYNSGPYAGLSICF